MKTLFFTVLIIFSFASSSYAGVIDLNKSKINLSFSIENNETSDVKKGKIASELKWGFEEKFENLGTVLTFYSKPYYSYSKTELTDEKEKISIIGLDAAKFALEWESIQPFIAIGIEEQKTTTTNSNNITDEKTNLLSNYTIGITFPFGKKNGASVTIFSKRKYIDFLSEKNADISGIDIAFDLVKLFTSSGE